MISGIFLQVVASVGIKVVGIAGGLFLFPVLSNRFVCLLLGLALRVFVAVIPGGRGFVEQFIG